MQNTLKRDPACIQKIRPIKVAAREALFSIPGVHSIDIDFKTINDHVTDTYAIVVHVDKKYDPKEAKDVIPKTIEGVPTDVVESEPFSLEPTKTSSDLDESDSSIAVQSGLPFGPQRESNSQATITMMVEYENEEKTFYGFIGNWHALYYDSNGKPGDAILQPNNGKNTSQLGLLAEGAIGQQEAQGRTVYVDVALCSVQFPEGISRQVSANNIRTNLPPSAIDTPKLNDAVMITAYNSNQFNGVINSVDLDTQVNWQGVTYTFNNLARANVDSWTNIGPGNSGALVIRDKSTAVGMVLGGNAQKKNLALLNLQDAFDYLNVRPVLDPFVETNQEISLKASNGSYVAEDPGTFGLSAVSSVLDNTGKFAARFYDTPPYSYSLSLILNGVHSYIAAAPDALGNYELNLLTEPEISEHHAYPNLVLTYYPGKVLSLNFVIPNIGARYLRLNPDGSGKIELSDTLDENCKFAFKILER